MRPGQRRRASRHPADTRSTVNLKGTGTGKVSVYRSGKFARLEAIAIVAAGMVVVGEPGNTKPPALRPDSNCSRSIVLRATGSTVPEMGQWPKS
jgi:hypothetical protein